MPTTREIVASLKGMRGAASSAGNQAKITAAANALLRQEKVIAERMPTKQELEDKEKRIAELEERLTEVFSGSRDDDAYTGDGDLALVASNGEMITVKASLARLASSYFVTALASGFQEAGSNRVKFDVDIAVLHFIASGIHTGKAEADLVTLPSPHDAGVIEQIISLSSYLRMPWLAQAAAHRALESSDAAMLVNLLLVAHDKVQPDPAVDLDVNVFALWEELSEALAQRVARMLEEASIKEVLSQLPLEVGERILLLVCDETWSEWHELVVVATAPAGGVDKVLSRTTREGFFLEVTTHTDRSVDAYVCVADNAEAPVVIGGEALVGFECEVQAKAGSSSDVDTMTGKVSRIIGRGGGMGWDGFLSPKETAEYVHGGGSYAFRFRARRTKLHVQCEALLKCAKSHLPPAARKRPDPLVPVLGLLRSIKGLGGHAMLVEYMAGAFRTISGEVLGQLSFCDMEAIISHPELYTAAEGELCVLKGVFDWAQSSMRLTPSVGATVLVRDHSEHELWRGAECRVVKKRGNLWIIERTSAVAGEALSVRAADLLCPGHVGLEKLLQHVRFPFIELQQINARLGTKGMALANQSPAFERGLTDAVEVQTGKRKAAELGARAQKRARGEGNVRIPDLDSKLVAKALVGSQ